MTGFRMPFSERNLILTGTVGPTQARLGRRIADQLAMPFVQLDTVISDRMDMPVSEIRAYYGETRLRTVEAEIVAEMALRRRSVIFVSGRTLIAGDNLARLRATGPVFCLTVALDAMLHRLHVAMGARYHNPQDRAQAVGDLAREWQVRDLEGVQQLDVTEMDDDEIVQTLVGLWRALTVRRA